MAAVPQVRLDDRASTLCKTGRRCGALFEIYCRKLPFRIPIGPAFFAWRRSSPGKAIAMSGRSEVDYSLQMIHRSKKRLSYQRAIVAKLRFDTDRHYADLVRDIELKMEAKLLVLLKRHASLVRDEVPKSFHVAKHVISPA